MEIHQILGNHELSIGLCFVLGALHALEPGHGKTALAAHALSEKGLRRPALIAFSTALSHSISILFIAAVVHGALDFSINEGNSSILFHRLNFLSGVVLFSAGLWLFYGQSRKKHQNSHSNGCNCHVHRKKNDLPFLKLSEVKKSKSINTVLLGLAVGLIPCPTALVALSQAVLSNDWMNVAVVTLTFAAGIFIGLFAVGGILGMQVAPRILSIPAFRNSGRAVLVVQAVVICITGAWHIYLGL